MGGEETSTMKEHFIMKGFIRKRRELYSEKIIRENNILHKKGIWKKRIVLLGKESYTIKKKTLLGKEYFII